MSVPRYLYVVFRATVAHVTATRPARVMLRVAVAAAFWLCVGRFFPGTPAGMAVQAAAALWVIDTTRVELSPAPRTPEPSPEGPGSPADQEES